MGKKIGIAFGILGGVILVSFVAALTWPVSDSRAELAFDYNPAEWPVVKPNGEYQTRHGDTLPLRVYGDGESDVALILLHGIGVYGYYFDEMGKFLAERSGVRVYAPDLRGHGYAPPPQGDMDHEEQLVDDLADLVNHIREELPLARIVVGGHSAGGGLAVRFAGSGQAEDIDGFLLIAPSLGQEAPSTNDHFGGLMVLRLPRLIGLSLLNTVGINALDGMEVLHLNYPEERQRERLVMAYSWRFIKGFAPSDYAGDLASIKTPLLLVAGSDDEIFDAEHYPAIISAHVSHGEVVIKPGYNHFEDVISNLDTLEVYSDWLNRFQ